jgi:hypothetical protein
MASIHMLSQTFSSMYLGFQKVDVHKHMWFKGWHRWFISFSRFGQVLSSRAVRAAHCLTSIQVLTQPSHRRNLWSSLGRILLRQSTEGLYLLHRECEIWIILWSCGFDALTFGKKLISKTLPRRALTVLWLKRRLFIYESAPGTM